MSPAPGQPSGHTPGGHQPSGHGPSASTGSVDDTWGGTWGSSWGLSWAFSTAATQPSGGWDKLSQFDDHIQRKRDQEQQRQKTLEAIEQIKSPVDLEIARLLQKDAQSAETEQRLAALEQLVAINFRNADLPKVKEFNEKVAKAFVRASVQGNFSAIQAFERELERAIEEEEFLLMALIMLE